MAKMKDITLKLDHSKETKGTQVFASDDEDAAVPTLYIRKAAIKGDVPDKITVTIKAG